MQGLLYTWVASYTPQHRSHTDPTSTLRAQPPLYNCQAHPTYGPSKVPPVSHPHRETCNQASATEAMASHTPSARFVLGAYLGDGDSPGGGGRWGCRLAFSRRSGRAYCGRLIPHLSDDCRAMCLGAADELKKLRHPNLQRIRAVHPAVAPDGTPAVAVISELFLGTSLHVWIAGRVAPVTNGRAERWLCEMAAGLAHLHSHGMLHGNLHSRNVHVARGERLKLGDFIGVVPPPPPPTVVAAASGEDGYIGQYGAGTRLTPWGLCPDSCQGDGSYTQASDVWALGGVLFEIVHLVRTGLYPPEGRGVCPAVVEMLRCGDPQGCGSTTSRPEGYTDMLMSTMESMLRHDANARPTAAQLAMGERDGMRTANSRLHHLATQTFPLDALHLPLSCGGGEARRPPTPSSHGGFLCVERLRVFLEDRLGLDAFRAAHSVVSAIRDDTDERAVVDELERILPHATLNLYLPALLHLVLRERDSYTTAPPAHAAPPSRIFA